MATLTLDAAYLGGILAACILYGGFLVLFGMTLCAWKNLEKKPPLFVMLSSLALFVLITIFLGFIISFIFDGFIVYNNTAETVAYLEQPLHWKEVVSTIVMAVTILLADGILVYRCWIVWDRNWWIIAFPVVLYVGGIAIVSVSLAAFISPALSDVNSVFAKSVASLSLAMIAYTLSQNVIVTGLIAFKLWRTAREVTPYSGRSFTPALAIVLESGCLYVVSLLMWLITDVKKSLVYYIVTCSYCPLIGVVFTSLILRVALPQLKAAVKASVMASSRSERSENTAYPMRPINVSVTEEFDVEDNLSEIDKRGSRRRQLGASDSSIHASATC